MFRCLECSLTENWPKYRRYVILCCLVVLIFYPWLNRGLPQTIELPLPTSRIHLRIMLFITCQDPLAEEVDLLLSHAKGFMFPEIRLYFFFVRTFWFSYHLWFKVFRLVTVYRPPPSKKNGFTVERFFSEFRVDCYILSITSLWWFQLSRRCRLKCKRQTNLWPFFFGWYFILYASSSGPLLGTGHRDMKKPFVLWNAP